MDIDEREGHGLSIVALRGHGIGPVSLHVSPGGCVALMGASGSGKTVLLRLIADLDPSDGHVFFDGVERDTFDAPAWRRRIGFVPAQSGWWAPTVADHVPAERLPAASALAEEMNLPRDVMERDPLRLSTGERQRLAFIRCLVGRPDAFLLDEPTSGLDPVTTERVEAVIRRELRRGAAVLLVTHDASQAERMARRVYRLADGALHSA